MNPNIIQTALIFLFTMLCLYPAEAQTYAPNYGKTPDELVPYGNYQKAYLNFFDEPQLFTGAGREIPEPTGLDAVKLGFLGPLEGSVMAPQGKHMLQGANLAIEEANANGGYRGIPFKLMVHNDVGLWGAAANEVVKMNDEKVWAFLGTIDDINSHVALRVALKLELPMVNTGDPDPTLTETRIPWLIRCISDDRQSSYALVDYIIRKQGHSRIAVIRANNRYGRVGIMEFNDAAQRLECPLVLEVRFEDGESDFSVQIKRLINSSPEAVVIWGNARESALILKQMREMGMEQAVFGCDRLVSREFLELAGSYSEGIVTTCQYNPTLQNPQLKSFTREYSERFGQEPDVFAAHAYDGMKILINAIHISGLNRVKIRDVLLDLETFQGYQGVTGELVLDASWNDIGAIWMAEVKNGRFEFSAGPSLVHE